MASTRLPCRSRTNIRSVVCSSAWTSQGASCSLPKCLKQHYPRLFKPQWSVPAAKQKLILRATAVDPLTVNVSNHALTKGTTLTQFLTQQPGLSADMVLLFSALQTATKTIASKVARASIDSLLGEAFASSSQDSDRDTPKKLDVVSNDVLKEALTGCGRVGILASEEDDDPVVLSQEPGKYVAVFDPLDGSRNIDAAIPTGTIFGIYACTGNGSAIADVLQPGRALVASGYSLYSSATMMVISVGSGTHGFTLDSLLGEFVLTHPNIRIPARGQIYSLNDARYFDWPKGLQQYIDTVRQGKGQQPVQYSSRYICSLVADFHRTLLYGGWAGNPRSHLRLVYEANPLALLVEQAGGRASDGRQSILDITPSKLHQRLPLFLGSSGDIAELESYGDVQQISTKKYTV